MRFGPGNTAGRIFKPGNEYRWPEGTSGNPRGITHTQLRFRELYVEALVGGTDEELRARASELAELAWRAARKGEPWAYQEIRAVVAPYFGADPRMTGETPGEPLTVIVQYVEKQMVVTGAQPLGLSGGAIAALPEGPGGVE